MSIFTTKRSLLLAGFLAACTQTVLTPQVAETISIRDVSVVTADIGQYSVRGLPISKDRFANDLKLAVERKLGSRRRADGNSYLDISVTRVLLKSPELSMLAGGQSFIDAKVQVRSVSDGTIIAGPTKFSGLPDEKRMGGIVGAMTAPNATEDYNETIEGFAEMLYQALFEGGATIY